jgi:hypothetical protein
MATRGATGPGAGRAWAGGKGTGDGALATGAGALGTMEGGEGAGVAVGELGSPGGGAFEHAASTSAMAKTTDVPLRDSIRRVVTPGRAAQ